MMQPKFEPPSAELVLSESIGRVGTVAVTVSGSEANTREMNESMDVSSMR